MELLRALPANGLVAWLLPRLVKALASRKEPERWAAYRSLVETGSAAVVPLLEALYPPGERDFRLLIVQALAELLQASGERSDRLSLFEWSMHEDDPVVRLAIREALRRSHGGYGRADGGR